MAVDGSVENGLKQALLETVCQLMSSDYNTRTNAEAQIKLLEVTDEFAVHLCEVIVDSSSDFSYRQLCSVLLKQYVDIHWSPEDEKFCLPECPPTSKQTVRHMLPMALREPHGKLRSTIAYAVSTIAKYDWPEQWGELFGVLMQALKSGQIPAVDGAMRVLAEFTRDVTETQMMQLVPVVLPEIYSLLTNPSTSHKIKGRAVQIFSTCIEVMVSMSQVDKSVLKTHLQPALPKYMEAFVTILKVPNVQIFHASLKIRVLKSLTELARSQPKCIASFLPEILGPVWGTLTESAEVYVKNVVNNSEDLEEEVDSDGEVHGLHSLVLACFEFVQALIESPKLRDPVNKGMSELLYYLILYMQITQEQMEKWASDPDKFVEEEDEETFAYGVRISALDVLVSLVEEFEDDCVLPICGAVTRHLQAADSLRSAGDLFWWKIHESSMFALQALAPLLVSKFHQKLLPPQFDLAALLESMVVDDMKQGGSNPFLVGRCLCFASKFPSIMAQPMLQSFLNMTVTALQPSQSAVMRISSVRALYGFCEYLKSKQAVSLLLPYLGPFVEALHALASEATPEALSLVLEALALVVSLDGDFSAMVESKVTPLAMAVFLKYSNDPLLVSLSQDIFKELCKLPSCSCPLQQRLLPTLIEILTASPEKMSTAMQAVALDVLATLVRFSPTPLSATLMHDAFPACANCVLCTDDITCMQNGGECLRAYVYAAYPQLVQWTDDRRQTGLHLVLKVCEHLLDPKAPESASAFVGRLVSTVVSRAAADLGQEGIEMLLRAVLSKLLHTQTCSVIQNLVLVFARLVHTDLNALLNFLTSVPGPSGESALAFVLTEWCSKQPLFFGKYDTKITILALAKLVEHAIQNNDDRLLSIIVKGDEIPQLHNIGPKTRSRAVKNPIQWTEIPVIVKIYKLLFRELCALNEDSWQDAETDSENEDNSETNGAESVIDGALVDVLDCVEDGDYDEEPDDPEMLNDPLAQVDLTKYLRNFIANVAQLPFYANFSQHHTPAERTALAAMGFAI